MPDQMRVLLVDDDPFTRVMLRTTLTSLGYVCVGDAATVPAALVCAREFQPDAAVVDLDLGEGPTGIDLAHGLRRVLPTIGIVMLSTYEEPRLMGHNLPALPAGTVYVVKKSVANPTILGHALEMSVDSAALAEDSAPAQRASRLSKLSDQQVEIMRLVAGGCSNAEIARRRFLTEPAVEKAVARLIGQLGLANEPGQNVRVLIAQLYYQLSGAVSVRRG